MICTHKSQICSSQVLCLILPQVLHQLLPKVLPRYSPGNLQVLPPGTLLDTSPYIPPGTHPDTPPVTPRGIWPDTPPGTPQVLPSPTHLLTLCRVTLRYSPAQTTSLPATSLAIQGGALTEETLEEIKRQFVPHLFAYRYRKLHKVLLVVGSTKLVPGITDIHAC